MRGNLFTTLSIGTILTFITDSCRLVVTLSKYSICSLIPLCAAPPFCIMVASEAATREFLAIISSLTRFINTSSFSISTRTVRFTTGLPPDCFAAAGCFAAGAAVCACGVCTAAGATAVPASLFSASLCILSLCSSASLLSSSSFITERSMASAFTDSISDTLPIAAITLSTEASVIRIKEKSKSKRSSSISCADGLETIISPSSSTALNTRNALAAFNRQLSCTLMVAPYTILPCFCASPITILSVPFKLISSHFLP